jgi:hypothetical protein
VEQWTHKPLVVGSNPTLATRTALGNQGGFAFGVSFSFLGFARTNRHASFAFWLAGTVPVLVYSLSWETTYAMTAGRKHTTENKHWGTPPQIVSAVRECFGGEIALDPCSNPYSVVLARVEYQPPALDGLVESWDYPTIYVNPPYGKDSASGTTIKDWLARCAQANQIYSSEVLALVPVATNTGHWKKYIYGRAAALCFLYDTRLKFLVEGQMGGKGAPMACAMVYWGRHSQRFFDTFICFGAVVDLQALYDVPIGSALTRKTSL